MKLVYTKKARINTVQTRGLGFKLIMHERTITVCTYILYRTGGARGIGGNCPTEFVPSKALVLLLAPPPHPHTVCVEIG